MGELKAWHRAACAYCGEEGLASRGEPVDVDAPYMCSVCETWQRGYEAGKAANADATVSDFEVTQGLEVSLDIVAEELLLWHVRQHPPVPGIEDDRCRACRIEAVIGTESCPHPIPEHLHACAGRAP